jgi:seryl-tRNA synthetase
MLDLRRLREQPEEARAQLARRGQPDALALLARALALDEARRARVRELDALKAQRNAASDEVGRRKRVGEPVDALLAELKELAEAIRQREDELRALESELEDMLLRIPNLPDPAVPDGGPECNRVVRTWGEPRRFDFEPRPHWELGAQLGLLDLARGAKISGSGFPLFRGVGARLERGLIAFMLDLHTREHGYTELWPPFLVHRACMVGTGQLPKFFDDVYHVPSDDLFLIPTAEVPVTNVHRDEILDGASLPRAYCAYSPCFRREAGAAGQQTRGLIRVHQFDKVELVRFERPEDSDAALEILTAHAERVLQILGLAYRVVLLASGDLGFAARKTYDLEVWAPGAGRWLEVSSCSNFGDFQARRAQIRFRRAPAARPEYVHTLNGSGLALPRTVVALLETYQNADGSVDLPEALWPYVGLRRLEPA